MFKGTYVHRIDPKGRLPVPAAFRRALASAGASSVVVTVVDECLAAYAPREWAQLEQHLRSLPAFSRPVKAITRLLASRAADCDLDVQGRILLPPALRATASLQGETVVVGVLDRFEIWNPERWAAFLTESERLLEDASLDAVWASLSTGSRAPRPDPDGPPSPSPSAGSHPQAKPRR